MAFIIDGTTGIATVDGSVSAPSQRGQDSNSGISYAADTIKFSTNGVERFAISNSGLSGDGSGLTGISGGGKVLQVIEGTSTSQTSVSTTTYSDIGLAVDITPQTNSKVLVLVNFQHNMNSNQEEGFGIKLLRGSTELYGSASQAEWYAYTASSGQFQNRATFNFYDGNPGGNGSTALTYKIQAATYASRTVEFMVNGSRSTITLIEIGA